MTNNDMLRRLRYAFNFSDDKMIQLFAAADLVVTRAEISSWMKKDDDPDWKSLFDKQFATFLNGMINDRRGKKEGEQPKPETTLNNNMILRKLRIALNLDDEAMLDILDAADMKISKHELSAFFRKPTQSNYRLCKDQILRNFLMGLQIRYRAE
jgi:uncharacterized protein YehS (DUF1456 family)